jgi:uncharacterized protein
MRPGYYYFKLKLAIAISWIQQDWKRLWSAYEKGNKIVIIIHHNDADGRCAAAIVSLSPFAAVCKDIAYIEADYGMAKTDYWDRFIARINNHYESESRVTRIFVVDFSLPESVMLRLNAISELHWIDHHESTKAFSYEYHQIKGLRDLTTKGRSGCELAWEYCFPDGMTVCTGEFGKVPSIVKLIGDYDTWRMEFADRCKPLILALDAMQCHPADRTFWTPALFGLEGPSELEFATVACLIDNGRVITKYRDGFAEGLRKSYGFDTKFEGLNCYALNLYKMGSLAFGNMMHTYDACLSFIYDGRFFTVSMYSEKPGVDCSRICAKHGGGGHKGAAGFTCIILPFKRL